jgi:hypothetical protein
MDPFEDFSWSAAARRAMSGLAGASSWPEAETKASLSRNGVNCGGALDDLQVSIQAELMQPPGTYLATD